MDALAITNSAALTMSSREIATLTGKRHDHVIRDIRVMLSKLYGEEGVPKFGDTYAEPQNGRTYPVFNLPKRETLILVSGYNVKMRAAIVDRWQELETKSTISVPNFSNPAEAARAWAEQYDARMLAEADRLLGKSMRYATVERMKMLYYGMKFKRRVLKSAAVQMKIPPIDVFDANYGTVKAYHADVWREAYGLEILL